MPSIADVVDLLAEQIPDVEMALGMEFQNENASPPRIVFLPRGDRFSAPRSIDRHRFHTGSAATRGVGLEARVWGAAREAVEAVEADPEADPPVEAVEGWDPGSYPELRATELLVDRLVMAIRTVAQGSYILEEGEWMDTSAAQVGRLYALRFRIELPVVPTDDEAARVTTTWQKVVAPADDPTGTPASITTTLELASDITGTPSP